MLKLVGAFVPLAASLLVAWPATAAAAAKRCGSVAVGEGVSATVTAKGLSCKRARRIARRYNRHISTGQRVGLPRGWSCNEGRPVVCAKGKARVTIGYGVRRSALAAKACGLRHNGNRYALTTSGGVRCKRARRIMRRFLRGGPRARRTSGGWMCGPGGQGSNAFVCAKGEKLIVAKR